MPVMLPSSEVQQNFGRVMDQALMEEEVIVERYGQPRVAILSYQRYQALLRYEQSTADVHVIAPRQEPEAQMAGVAQADAIRQALGTALGDSLDEAMTDLRGRVWSS